MKYLTQPMLSVGPISVFLTEIKESVLKFDAAARMLTCRNHRQNDPLCCSGVGDQRDAGIALRHQGENLAVSPL